MFDKMDGTVPVGPAGVAGGGLDAAAITAWVTDLAMLDRDVDDRERVDRIRALEDLKAAAAAAQAVAAADLDTSVRTERAARGLPAALQGKGVAAQVALARRVSPHRGGRDLDLATALVTDMPATLGGMRQGRISEWRATLLVRETAHLSAEHRRLIDQALAADPRVLDGVGDTALVGRIRVLANRLDPAAAVRRARKAEADRRVTIRPAPDTMVHLSALLPVKEGVAAYAALLKAADTARGSGDPRGRGQLMADTLVQRLTGHTPTESAGVELQVVITDRALLHGDNEPAHLLGYGPVPAGLVRTWLNGQPSNGQPSDGQPNDGQPNDDDEAGDGASIGQVWLRRLYTHPGTGELVATESRRRLFPAGLRRQVVTRDLGTCRTPWCDAPIRHLDHIVAHHAGGKTSVTDGQGLCERCNHTKQAPGWRARPRPGPDGEHRVQTTTPTGHRYTSGAPPLPGAAPSPLPGWSSLSRPDPTSRIELYYRDLILTA